MSCYALRAAIFADVVPAVEPHLRHTSSPVDAVSAKSHRLHHKSYQLVDVIIAFGCHRRCCGPLVQGSLRARLSGVVGGSVQTGWWCVAAQLGRYASHSCRKQPRMYSAKALNWHMQGVF
jgi:hypothetical protein